MKLYEKTINSEKVYSGKIFDVFHNEVILEDDSTAYRDVVIHSGGAGVIAVDENEEITLVKQYRAGAECVMLEIPAGKNEKNEDPLKCAERELFEETGIKAGKIFSLGEFFPTPAYCGEKIYIYLARELEKFNAHKDFGEFLETVSISLDKAYEMVLKNEITDAKTIIAILKAYSYLKR